ERYKGVSGFREFAYNPNAYNESLGFLEDESIDVSPYTASELLAKLYEASHPDTIGGKDLESRLINLIDIARLVKSKDTNDYVRKEEVEALIRDLSLTHEGRKTAFGTHELNS